MTKTVSACKNFPFLPDSPGATIDFSAAYPGPTLTLQEVAHAVHIARHREFNAIQWLMPFYNHETIQVQGYHSTHC